MVGLIPAAGRGVRAYPYTKVVPKSLLEVDGVTLLQRNIELLRDQIGVERIVIVVGHLGNRIRELFGNGLTLGVAITYVENDRLDRELPYSIYLGTEGVDGPCCVVLADECYVGTNHRDLVAESCPGALLTCALIQADSPRAVRNNYSVEIVDGRIVRLHEKPKVLSSLLMGTGTYLLQPEAITRLRDAFADERTRPRDWTTWLDGLAREGSWIAPFRLDGRYVNVNGRNELNQANYLERERSFPSRSVSVVYVCDHDEDSAGPPVVQFAEQERVAEVVAITRRPTPSLERAARHGKVRLVAADSADTPVGDLVRAGLDAARGDILVVTYSDDTFSPNDLVKILVYLRDADLVVGTRTTRQMIEQGSNMRGAVRVAHVLLAKVLEILWWRFDARFTDICCVYRGMWRSTYATIRGELSSRGVEILPEMVIEVLRARQRVIEIPVNYYNRDLVYPTVRSRYQNFGTFVRILRMMLRKRLAEIRARGGAM